MANPDVTRPSVSLSNLNPSYQPAPSIPWAMNYVTSVPESAVAWMIAQGWNITGISWDTDTTPSTPYYSMARVQMNNLSILQSLVNEFTNAYNEGRQKNALRYNDLVSCWYATATAAADQLDEMGANSGAFYTNYHLTISALVEAIGAWIAISHAQVTTDAGTVETKLGEYLTELAKLHTNYTAHLAKIETLIASQRSNLAAYISEYATELAKLESQYNTCLADIRTLESTASSDATSHIAQYQLQISGLETDYTSHQVLAEGYLTDLGTTELARINEAFDNALAAEQQKLVDRGFYSSALAADIITRNTRERNEAIAALNDRLNREKLENEHRLYEQKVGMRTRTMEGLDRINAVRAALTQWKTDNETKLYAQFEQVRLRIAEGMDRRHAVNQEVERNETAQRDKELAELQAAVGGTLDGRAKHADMTARKTQFQVDARYKLYAQQLEADMVRLRAISERRLDEKGLMQYQLEARNKLLVGFMEFMERRTDSYPNIEQIGNLVTQLGDAGSTQVVRT
jgi:hypothetical protein